MKIKLPDVTLAMVDRVDPDWSARTLNYCCRKIEFASVELWSFEKPRVAFRGKFHRIPKFTYKEHFQWMSDTWPQYISAKFVLNVHKDGFILNPHLWNKEFLQYDYIGAPWPVFWGHVFRVGNGGFSLRSRRFLQATMANGHLVKDAPEDLFYCVTMRPEFEARGIRYAPVELAATFSQEHPIEEVPFDDTKVFGFHAWTHDSRKKLCHDIRDGVFDEKPGLLKRLGRLFGKALPPKASTHRVCEQ